MEDLFGDPVAEHPEKKLSLKQKLFCEIYVAQAPFFRQGVAAEEAGYRNPQVSACNLLALPAIQNYILELRERAALRNNITLDDIINQYAKIAFFDVRMLYNEDGGLKSIPQLDDIAATAVCSIKEEILYLGNKRSGFEVGRTIDYKTADRITALDRLRECLGWVAAKKKVVRDADGKIISTETESDSQIGNSTVIFENYSEPLQIENVEPD